MDTCFVTAKLTAKKGMEAQLEAEVVKNIPNVRAEKGCIRYDFHKNRSEDGTFLFYEIWESPVAALGFVREALVKQQQEMGRQKGIVMDGRDIGTVVFPDAELKIFVTASADIRARRRYDELKAKGRPASYDEILKNVEERDYIDQNREVGPLRKAEDAILLDNSHMTIAEQKQWLAEQFQKATNG